MHSLNHTKYRGITPKNGSVTFSPNDLKVPLSEVAKCAGGSRYQMDSKIKELAQSMFNQALSLVRPAYGYTASDVINTVPDKGFVIENNILIPCSLDIQSKIISIISLICTIGADLELKVQELNTKCMQLEALFLDASGVALLEATAQQAYVQICKQAIKVGLYAGYRWEPGCDKISLEGQEILFDLVDAHTVGVQLMEGRVMHPFKSLSFWVPLTRHRTTFVNWNKCRGCSLKDCIYRTRSSAKKKHNRNAIK